MVVPITYASWKPPKLTEQEELEFGRQIALQGRKKWAKEFRKSLGKSVTKSYESMDYTKNWNPTVRRIFNIGMAIFILAGLCLMTKDDWKNLGSILIPIAIIGVAVILVSYYWTTRKFDSWVDYLVAKYATHVAKGGYTQDYRN
jgi:hypothetical protein